MFLLPAALNVLTSLAHMIKDLHTPAKWPVTDENSDTHQLNPDALLQIEMALDAASQLVALATHGSLHPEHVHRINLNDLKRIIKDEVEL